MRAKEDGGGMPAIKANDKVRRWKLEAIFSATDEYGA